MSRRGSIDIDGATPEERAQQSGEEPPADPADPYEPPPRRPKSERTGAFDLGAWLLEGVLGIDQELRHNDLGLPEEFWVHAYAARKETLLALRALVDEALARCATGEASTRSRQRTEARQRRGRVEIDFE